MADWRCRAIGSAEFVSFADMVKSEFMSIYQSEGIADAPPRRQPDMIDSIWEDIYELVFKPDNSDIRYNNIKSRLIPYRVDDVESVVKMFIKLNRRYGGVIKYNTFSELTGISRYTIDLWNKANNTNGYIFSLSDKDIKDECNNIYIINRGNDDVEYIKYNGNLPNAGSDRLSSIRFDVKKKLQEAMQDSNTNGLSLDSMGHMARANNDEDLGKLYDPKKMLLQAEIKQQHISGDVLPRLGDGEVKGIDVVGDGE